MDIRDMLVACQGMADEDRVRARGVQRAVGLVSDLQRRQPCAGIERERLGFRQAQNRALRSVGLA